MLAELENNQTNEIPWTCYRVPNQYEDFVIPRDWYVSSFVDRRGRTIEFTHIVSWQKFHEYVLASQIGEWLLTGRRVLDFDNLSTRVRIKNLCDKIPVDGLEQAVYDRNKEQHLAHLFIRAYTEFQYQTNPISLKTARNLRFYEQKKDMWSGAHRMSDKDFHVHHILPRCEFEELETDLRNLVKIPKPVHALLHDVYDDINNRKDPGKAFCERWLGVIPCKAAPEYGEDFQCGFFDDICHDWFNQRTNEKDICEKIASAMGLDDDRRQMAVNVVRKYGYVTDFESDSWGQQYVAIDDTCLPWWWTQHWATIANMCAYIYADHVHRRLA